MARVAMCFTMAQPRATTTPPPEAALPGHGEGVSLRGPLLPVEGVFGGPQEGDLYPLGLRNAHSMFSNRSLNGISRTSPSFGIQPSCGTICATGRASPVWGSCASRLTSSHRCMMARRPDGGAGPWRLAAHTVEPQDAAGNRTSPACLGPEHLCHADSGCRGTRPGSLRLVAYFTVMALRPAWRSSPRTCPPGHSVRSHRLQLAPGSMGPWVVDAYALRC
jgi:hypothetical protein